MEKTIFISALLVALSLPVSATSGGGVKRSPDDVISFTTAKNKLYSKVFNNSGETLYCDCDWSNRKTNLNSCNLQSYFPRTEAEHVIPASWMLKVNNKKRQCAIDSKDSKDSAREYCQKYSAKYKQAHNDLVNLYPAVGQINADRSNKPFVDITKTKVSTYGKCDIQIGSRGIVPPKSKQGDIARIAFYMSEKYGVTYSKRQLTIFNKWDKEDPISPEERAHNKRVIQTQGFGLIQ